MFRLSCAAFLLSPVVLAFPASASETSCTIPGQLAGQHHACAPSGGGIAIAESPERARYLIGLAEAGAERFERYFGQKATPFAIVERTEGGLTDAEQQALKDAGYAAVLPWLSPQGFRNQMTQSVRRAFDAGTAGMEPEQRELAWQSALAQLEPRVAEAAANERDTTAIPHELGHMWLIRGFWPEAGAAAGGHYGGPGPDWLDELAAVILEPDPAADARRKQFGKRYAAIRTARARGELPTDELLDLVGYFTKGHPVGANPQELMNRMGGGATDSGATIRVLTGAEAQRIAGDGIRFYLQSRLVADFILDRSGDPVVFGEVATAMARDPDFAAWLASSGAHHDLPGSISEFEQEWLRWLEQRYPDES